jgi:hypothetical protein
MWSVCVYISCGYFIQFFSTRLFSLQGSFVIKVNGPDGWSWDPEKVCYFSVIDEILSYGFIFLLFCHICMQLCMTYVSFFFSDSGHNRKIIQSIVMRSNTFLFPPSL